MSDPVLVSIDEHVARKRFDQLGKTKQDELFKKFEFSISDHMPIWLLKTKNPHPGNSDDEKHHYSPRNGS